MLTRAFRAGTAGLVTLSLMLPPAAMAQDLPAELAALPGAADLPRVDGTLQVCVLGDAAPCLLLGGQVTVSAEEAAAELAAATRRAEKTARQLVRADARALGRAERAAPEDQAVAEEPAPEVEDAAPEAVAEEPAPEVEDAAPEAVAEEPAPEVEDAVDPRAAARAERRAARAAERQAAREAELEAAREEAGRDASGETVEATADAGLTETTAEAEAELQAEEQEAAAEVSAATDPAAAAAEVETTVVEAGDVRSSDEEIARSSGDAEAQAESRRRGLSPVETIALLGVGALIVGALLDNGDEVVSTSDDRAVARRPDGSTYVIKDDDTLLRQPGNAVETRRFADGSTITTVTRQDGSRVQTIRDATGRVLRRTRILADGTEVELFDDTETVAPVDVSTLPRDAAPEVDVTRRDLVEVLAREDARIDRRYSLGQIRNIRAVRELVPLIDLDAITFDSGSAAIRTREVDKLIDLGNAMRELIARNPAEMFLIEGHTDAVGSVASNLTLSDRRAESLALALSEYFDIPPENMVIQGYGESYLKVPTLAAERANRRVAVRRITPLLVARN